MATKANAKTKGYVGQPLPRVEDRRLLTGDSQFGADVDQETQLHARMVRSEVPFGELGEIDTAEAAALPGVVGVYTAADVPETYIPIRLFPTEDAERALQPVLARGYVRYVGDPFAIVVAEDPYVAEDAAELVRAEIEPLEANIDPIRALDDDAPRVHPNLDSNKMDPLVVRHGEDVDELFEGAEVVVDEWLRVHRHGAVPMEPRVLLAQHDPAAGRLSVWGAAKVKHFNRRALAGLLGLQEDDVRLIECDVGGGFGARGELYPEDYLVSWLAIELNRPVKWIEDRHENLIAMNHSREQVWNIQAAADADGNLLGYRAKAWWNQGAYVRTHGSKLLPNLILNNLPGPYRWRGWETETVCVLTNKTGAGTYRGPGQYEPTFVRERMVDLLAGCLGMDRAEFRRRNMVRPQDLPYEIGVPDVDSNSWMSYTDGNFPETFDRLMKTVGYEEMVEEAERRRAEGECVGIGVTSFVEIGNPGSFEQSKVVPDADGMIWIHVGVASVGQGVQTVLAHVAADILDIDRDRIRITHHDTDVIPEGQGAFSSRGTVFGGHAVAGAVANFLDNARAAAAKGLAVEPENIVIEKGEARAKRGRKRIPVTDLGVEGEYRYEPGADPEHSHILMGANLALVRVDPETGGVELLRYGISYDVGKAMNPLTLVGQVRGAAVQGIAGALYEEFSYSEDGQPLSTSFMDYAMPTAAEVSDIDVLLLESGDQDDSDPMAGAKGGGEGGIIATAATLSNAVADAVGAPGRELLSLPITPERVQKLAARMTVAANAAQKES
jgi:carbon-monoxide dehydrogenase large subunit